MRLCGKRNVLPRTKVAPIHPSVPHLSPRRNQAKPAPHSGSRPYIMAVSVAETSRMAAICRNAQAISSRNYGKTQLKLWKWCIWYYLLSMQVSQAKWWSKEEPFDVFLLTIWWWSRWDMLKVERGLEGDSEDERSNPLFGRVDYKRYRIT